MNRRIWMAVLITHPTWRWCQLVFVIARRPRHQVAQLSSFASLPSRHVRSLSPKNSEQGQREQEAMKMTDTWGLTKAGAFRSVKWPTFGMFPMVRRRRKIGKPSICSTASNRPSRSPLAMQASSRFMGGSKPACCMSSRAAIMPETSSSAMCPRTSNSCVTMSGVMPAACMSSNTCDPYNHQHQISAAIKFAIYLYSCNIVALSFSTVICWGLLCRPCRFHVMGYISCRSGMPADNPKKWGEEKGWNQTPTACT